MGGPTFANVLHILANPLMLFVAARRELQWASFLNPA